VTKYEFLSDEWIDAVFALVVEYRDDIPTDADLLLNVEVLDSPWGDRQLHLGATEGAPQVGHGFHDEADLTLALDYITAAEVFASGDPQAGLTAFLMGKVRVQGDVTKLIAAGTITGIPLAAPEVASKIVAFTVTPSAPSTPSE